MNKCTTWFMGALLLGLSLSTGCMSRAFKEGLGAATGAKGIYVAIQPLSSDPDARPLGTYTQFELGTIRDNFGGRVPPELLSQLPIKFAEQLAKKNLPTRPGGKTLLLRGDILHYEAEGMLGLAFGDFEEVVARIQMVDKASGKVLATANCIGRTKESVNRGVGQKTSGLAKAIVKWIDRRYPETGRD